MPNIFLISDTHFSHQGVCKFLRNDGTKLRPWDNYEEMDEVLIKNWNEVVKQDDKVYHLGDVAIRDIGITKIMPRLMGNKRLIRGNHDIFKTKVYQQFFKEIYGVRVLEDMILSHIPLHPGSITTRYKTNVHGHTHANRVLLDNGKIDPRYYCVAVEQINYTPIELSVLRKLIKEQQ